MKSLFILWTAVFFAGITRAQIIPKRDFSNKLVQSSDLSIPTTPAFVLLGLTPSTVVRPGTVRDFKVDWSLKSYKVAPNLALEAQPVWLMFQNRPFEKYHKQPKWVKTLSTLSVSAGTNQSDTAWNFAYAFKINLFHERNRFVDKKAVAQLIDTTQKIRLLKKLDLDTLQLKLDTASTPESRFKIKELIYLKRAELRKIQRELNEGYKNQVDAFMQKKWNTSMLDLAFGRVFTFNKVSFDSLDLRGAGYGVWLNGALGLGDSWLLTGLVKYTEFKTGSSLQNGVNFRYGNFRYNFFVEATHEKFFGKERISLAFGGDLKVSPIVVLSYGIRTDYTRGLAFKNFIPIANVTCLMR